MTAPVLAPCLPGCEHTATRIAELADRLIGAHVCTLTVGMVEVQDSITPVAVQVIRLVDVDGNVEAPRVEINGVNGRPATDVALTARSAEALAAALRKAAEIAGGAR